MQETEVAHAARDETAIPVPGDAIQESTVPENQHLDAILGADPTSSKKEGTPINEVLIPRWSSYLRKGLDKETKDALANQCFVAPNCPGLVAPKLNPEVESALRDNEQKRDGFLSQLQNRLGVSMSVIAIAMDPLLKGEQPVREVMMTLLANAAKILAGVHHSLSAHRQHVLGPVLNQNIKKVALAAGVDDYLFGADLGDRVKAAQTMEKAAVQVAKKPAATPGPSHTGKRGFLNSKRPAHKKRLKFRERGREDNPYRKMYRTHLRK